MANTTLTPATAALVLASQNAQLTSVQSVSLPVPSVQWTGLTNGSVGPATPAQNWTQAWFAVSGIFGGSGGACFLQGSNDGQTWVNLAVVSDPAAPGAVLYSSLRTGGPVIETLPNGGVLLAVTAGMDGFKYLRPVVAQGDSSTLVGVNLQFGTTAPGGAIPAPTLALAVPLGFLVFNTPANSGLLAALSHW